RRHRPRTELRRQVSGRRGIRHPRVRIARAFWLDRGVAGADRCASSVGEQAVATWRGRSEDRAYTLPPSLRIHVEGRRLQGTAFKACPTSLAFPAPPPERRPRRGSDARAGTRARLDAAGKCRSPESPPAGRLRSPSWRTGAGAAPPRASTRPPV